MGDYFILDPNTGDVGIVKNVPMGASIGDMKQAIVDQGVLKLAITREFELLYESRVFEDSCQVKQMATKVFRPVEIVPTSAQTRYVSIKVNWKDEIYRFMFMSETIVATAVRVMRSALALTPKEKDISIGCACLHEQLKSFAENGFASGTEYTACVLNGTSSIVSSTSSAKPQLDTLIEDVENSKPTRVRISQGTTIAQVTEILNASKAHSRSATGFAYADITLESASTLEDLPYSPVKWLRAVFQRSSNEIPGSFVLQVITASSQCFVTVKETDTVDYLWELIKPMFRHKNPVFGLSAIVEGQSVLMEQGSATLGYYGIVKPGIIVCVAPITSGPM